MGNIIGVDISCGKVVFGGCSCFGKYNDYVHNLEENVEDLYAAMQRLGELRDDVSTRVSVCQNNGLRPLARVEGWVSRVADIEKQVTTLLQEKDQEIDRLCVGGYCSQSCISSYKYGKRVLRKLTMVNELRSEGDFPEVGQEGPRPVVDERPIGRTIGLDAMVDRIWSFMMESTLGVLGLYGMGGVGKTTLLTCINNRFLYAPNNFDIVIWVSVSREVQIQRIQDDIGKKVGLFKKSWKRLRQDEKAVGILRKLRQKKFVLLLDDIWTRLDFTEIGVPVPDENNGCKVIFNTRFHNICGLMEADRAIEVKCLDLNDAWDLFQMKAGRRTLENDAGIFECAQRIAEKCEGLPLALTTIGVSMRFKKTKEEWERALEDLTTSMTRFGSTTDKDNAIFPLLKFSFDKIKDKKIQSGFLFCALLPQDYSLEKDELVDYWIGEGIVDGFGDRNIAMRRGHEIIRNLVNACLLIEEGSRHVKMHDVIRRMALWVASDSKRGIDYSVVRTHGQVDDILDVKNPQKVTRMSLMNHEIVDLTSFRFPKLVTLIARRNRFPDILCEFFRSLKFLKVLDLSQNQGLTSLPEDVSALVSLEYLNLSWTRVRWLPESFRKLVKLRYLNLENTFGCIGISAVSSLRNLHTLRLYNCGFHLEDPSESLPFVGTLAELKHLKVLTIDIGGREAFEMLVNFNRLTISVRVLSVHKYGSDSDSLEISSFIKMTDLESLVICMSDVREIKVNVKTAQKLYELSRNISFRSLYSVRIERCPNLKHLTWLLLAPNLTQLILSDLEQLEEVIREDKADSIIVEQPFVHVQPFQKLKDLTLMNMPELRSIYETSLPFPYLENIAVVDCPKLKKLPLDLESANGKKLVIQGSEEWIRNIKWKDEATKKAFTLSY